MSEQQGYIWPNLAGGPVITDKQGIDYLIVIAGQRELEIHFLEPIASVLEQKSAYLLSGGERVTDVTISDATKLNSRTVLLTLNKFGDWAPYQLAISEAVWQDADLDPVFSWIRFSFKVSCPNDIDCRQHPPGFEKFPDLYNFDYLAKDYESFKQAMLDRLPSTISEYWDRAEADFGIAIIDLLAYAGDRLSYYQDRVAAESQLTTARSRESVSGHLKLLDYALDPGQTATTYICLEVNRDLTVSAETQVETPARDVPYETPETFTLIEPFSAYQDLNLLKLYDFSHPSLFIPRGATQITVREHAEGLKPGRRLVVRQGDEDDNCQYHLLQLSEDPVFKKASDGSDITILRWEVAYALPWDAALSKTQILGNVAQFSHGKILKSPFYVDQDMAYYDLTEGPLGYKNGKPQISIKVDGEQWQSVNSLKTSQPYHLHYQIVDLDNGKNRIRFGDNINGLRPPKYAHIEIEYLVNLGRQGNVAANTLTRLPDTIPGIINVFNPFPGWGGRDPETEAHGKMWGPKNIRKQQRAVTPDDYAREAMSLAGVSKAGARFVWTGSWVTVRITLDPQGEEELSAELKAAVYDFLRTRKMAGYDIQLYPALYVPLDISIRFCLEDLAFRDQVLLDLKSALGNGTGADGSQGFFHPDNWTFGQSVTLAGLYAAIARVNGIECAEVLTFKRLYRDQDTELSDGLIPMQWDEIPRMEDDRNFPEHGKMDLELVGGR